MNPVVFAYDSWWYLAMTCTSVGAAPKGLCLIMTKVVFVMILIPFFCMAECGYKIWYASF